MRRFTLSLILLAAIAATATPFRAKVSSIDGKVPLAYYLLQIQNCTAPGSSVPYIPRVVGSGVRTDAGGVRIYADKNGDAPAQAGLVILGDFSPRRIRFR